MTPMDKKSRDRLLSLLADRATEGLDAASAAELATLASTHPDVDLDALDRLAAMIDVAMAGPPRHRLRRSFKAKILAGANRFFAPDDADSTSAPPPAD